MQVLSQSATNVVDFIVGVPTANLQEPGDQKTHIIHITACFGSGFQVLLLHAMAAEVVPYLERDA